MNYFTDPSVIFQSSGGENWLVNGNGQNLTRLLKHGIVSISKDGSNHADIPAALPSSADVSSLQPLLSPPSAVIVRSTSYDSVVLTSPSLPCFVNLDDSLSASSFASYGGNVQSGLT